jgi:hypothetical protein
MKTKTITVSRLKNLGNYENIRLDSTAEIEEGETLKEAYQKLKAEVEDAMQSKPKDDQEFNVF